MRRVEDTEELLAKPTAAEFSESPVLTRFLQRESVIGVRSTENYRVALSPKEREIVLYKFADAWEKGDLQDVLMVVGNPSENYLWTLFADKVPGRMEEFVYWYQRKNGLGRNLFDLADAVTDQHIRHVEGQRRRYYRDAPDLRPMEIFANFVAIAGDGNVLSKLILEKFFPRISLAMRTALESIE